MIFIRSLPHSLFRDKWFMIASKDKKKDAIISHTMIIRWVHQYGPELDKRIRPSIV
ncbi:hypothetical protein [Bacillus thuringiensis]|uniref:hypothetical protein n=1 Tax=Bacillus thuringiensis TaxID=1428 RepID=UPI001593108D|nr:hypothetical protein [Bacillus thuringiensis]